MCFSLIWFRDFLIMVVIVCAVVGIIKLLVPFILEKLGAGGGVIMGALNIFMWAVVAIFVIYICFALISCLMGGGMSLLPRR